MAVLKYDAWEFCMNLVWNVMLTWENDKKQRTGNAICVAASGACLEAWDACVWRLEILVWLIDKENAGDECFVLFANEIWGILLQLISFMFGCLKSVN